MGGPNYFLCNAQQTENFLQMYKNGIWKPQELWDYFPQAQKVYIKNVVTKKKKSQIRCIHDQKLFALRLRNI